MVSVVSVHVNQAPVVSESMVKYNILSSGTEENSPVGIQPKREEGKDKIYPPRV